MKDVESRRFCPNCHAELRASQPAACWNCDADLTAPDGWRPTVRPLGGFRPRTHEPSPEDSAQPPAQVIEPASTGEGGLAFRIIIRAFVGLIAILPLLQMLNPSASLRSRVLSAGLFAAAMFVVLLVGHSYTASMGLVLLGFGGSLTWMALSASTLQNTLAAGLLCSACAASLIGMQSKRRAVRGASQVLFVVGALGILFTGQIIAAFGYGCLGLGVLCLAGAWEEWRQRDLPRLRRVWTGLTTRWSMRRGLRDPDA